jgi:hypothetical protein
MVGAEEIPILTKTFTCATQVDIARYQTLGLQLKKRFEEGMASM